jgi:hypothetical protein
MIYFGKIFLELFGLNRIFFLVNNKNSAIIILFFYLFKNNHFYILYLIIYLILKYNYLKFSNYLFNY